MASAEFSIPLSNLPNFDPRRIPVIGVDTHLPPVRASNLSPAALHQRFVTPPSWQPEVLAEPRFKNGAAIAASVLIPIVVRPQPTVLLTRRAAHMSTHSGQIAFPGGKQDVGEELLATALREAHEEVGLHADFVQILGALPTYRTGSAFIITPFVALVKEGFTLDRNAEEVDEIFEVPLRFLMNPANHRWHALESGGVRREWISMPYLDGPDERFIWGATAGMLRNFYRFLVA